MKFKIKAAKDNNVRDINIYQKFRELLTELVYYFDEDQVREAFEDVMLDFYNDDELI